MSDENDAQEDPVLSMLERMHTDAAQSQSEHGAHASSSEHEQLAAKYRDAKKR